MKTVRIPRPVRDVDGLLEMFRKAEPPFGIVSVGADPGATYVYLEDHEGRDPAPIVKGWVDAPELRASATGQIGPQNVVEALANGVDVHTVLIQKVDPSGNIVPGDEKLSIEVPEGLAVSDRHPRLNEGMAMIQVGPSQKSGDFSVVVSCKGDRMKPATLPLRFVVQRVQEVPVPQEVAPAIERGGGVMAAIRKWLGI